MTATLAMTIWCDAVFCDKNTTILQVRNQKDAREEAARDLGWLSPNPLKDFCTESHWKGEPLRAEVNAALARVHRQFETPRDRSVIEHSSLVCHCGHPLKFHVSPRQCGGLEPCPCREVRLA